MKFYIGVDCEGVACGVGAPGGSLNASRNVDFCRRQATREANAAATALFDAGATEVIVWDNHGGSLNLDYEQLDRRCRIALGASVDHRWPGIDDSFAGVLFIGYHAMEGTRAAPMCHTFSSEVFGGMWINGRAVGELAIDAAVAGEVGVPPIFVASDDKAVAEARDFFGEIQTVTTKIGTGWNGAISEHPLAVLDTIAGGVKRAVERLGEARPFHFDPPLEYDLKFKRMDAAEGWARRSAGELVDAFTVRQHADSILELF